MKANGRAFLGLFLLALTVLTAGSALAGTHRLGGGLHYLRNLGDIEDNGFESNSFSILASYQYDGGLLKFEGDVDYIFDYLGTDEAMWEPSGWVLIGDFIYGGAGIGIGNFDGEWQTIPSTRCAPGSISISPASTSTSSRPTGSRATRISKI